jgi:hypothetical protein
MSMVIKHFTLMYQHFKRHKLHTIKLANTHIHAYAHIYVCIYTHAYIIFSTKFKKVRFQVLKAANMKVIDCLLGCCIVFSRTNRSQLACQHDGKAVSTSETSVNFYETVQSNVIEGGDLQTRDVLFAFCQNVDVAGFCISDCC